MKIKVFGSFVSPGPRGDLTSYAPGQIVDVDDRDKTAVAFYQRWVDTGTAEVVEPRAMATGGSVPAKAAAKVHKGEAVLPAKATKS